MVWRDIEDGAWEGITVRLTADDVGRAPAWCTDVAYPSRVRLTAGGAARWWARQEPGRAGVDLLRGEPMSHDDAVVRAITADDVRAATAAPGTCKDVQSLEVLGAKRARGALPSRWDATWTTILRAQGHQWKDDFFEEDWYVHNGSRALLPMRPASLAESGRVKAWRKRAREGTLPPVLVHFIGALDMFVLLDGHDRYAAAREEGVPVPWLHVSAVTLEPVTLDERKQAAIVREVERLSGVLPAVSTASLNLLYAGAFDDRPWPSRMCFGRVLAGGARQWGEEVRRRLAALGKTTDGYGMLG